MAGRWAARIVAAALLLTGIVTMLRWDSLAAGVVMLSAALVMAVTFAARPLNRTAWLAIGLLLLATAGPFMGDLALLAGLPYFGPRGYPTIGPAGGLEILGAMIFYYVTPIGWAVLIGWLVWQWRRPAGANARVS